MKVREVQFDPALILGPADKAGQVRSEGLHVSQVYGDLERSLHPENLHEEDMTPEQLKVYRSMGFLWEHAIEEALIRSQESDVVVRPGEYAEDGMACSPDLIHITNCELWECKATWRSAAKWGAWEKHFWVWLVQMKWYCWVLRVNRAFLLTFFVNGDYRPPRPCIRAAYFEFSDQELQENRVMLINHARRRGWLSQ